jgi:ParB family transcriptional regulator, chromosome partitioning protein
MTTTFTVTEIALNKLDVAEANVRRTGRGNGIEELAASIAAHGLLQSLVVCPKLDDSGEPTGRYEVVAGGRRLTALKLLAKRKAFGKTGPVPCRVLDGEDAGEASLAENVVRLDMHPADQFEAFARLHQDGQGRGIEEITARFGVSAHTVRQRLRLSAVSPRLLQAYRDEALTLDQVMAFAVTGDQAEQERVHGQLQDWQRNPDTIRRLLTHSLVPATDRKVMFVGLDAYTAAGGTVQRDLFSDDRGGWITDAALLERLLASTWSGWPRRSAPKAGNGSRSTCRRRKRAGGCGGSWRTRCRCPRPTRCGGLSWRRGTTPWPGSMRATRTCPTRLRPSWWPSSGNWTRSVRGSGSIVPRTSRGPGRRLA